MKASDVFPSKFLKADALKGPDGRYTTLVSKIVGVHTSEPFDDGNRQRVLELDNEKQLGLNKTNWNTLAELLQQEDDDNWVGATIELWVDPNVFYAGKKTPSIRVREPAGGIWDNKGGKSTPQAQAPAQAPAASGFYMATAWADWKKISTDADQAAAFKTAVEKIEKSSGVARDNFNSAQWAAVLDESVPF
jgi:hypothetical protein